MEPKLSEHNPKHLDLYKRGKWTSKHEAKRIEDKADLG